MLESKKERIRSYKQDWHIKNRDKVLLKSKIWSRNNKNRKREIDKLWKINNKEKVINGNKQYYSKIKLLKKALLNPSCLDCGNSLENFRFVRCKNCSKNYHKTYLKEFRARNRERTNELNRKYIKQRKDRENQRRLKLGLPLIGNNFKKEQELILYVKNIFPNIKIIVHDRSTLERRGMELDIFIPELKLAFEYHGRQHFEFESTGYWKDYAEFEEQQERDEIKRNLCVEKGITLIEITCYEKLSEQLVLTKLNKHKINHTQSVLLDNNKISELEIKSESNGGN